MQAYFYVTISHIEISCKRLLMSVDFCLFVYLVFIIFGSDCNGETDPMFIS